MFRASVGHRHGPAGLLPVAELLHRRQPATPSPSSHDPDIHGPAHDPTRSGEPILCPERQDARRTWALATVLALFTALLCASAAAIAAVTAPIAARSGPEPPSTAAITGTTALRPDLLGRSHWPFDHTPASDPRDGLTSGPSALPPTALVDRFTAELDTDPALAVRQLSPALVRDQGPLVAEAWATAGSVRADDLGPAGPNAATATITARFPDGKRISMREEFRTAGDRISAVRLLGASVQH